jgi:hypothetical protein
MGTLRKLPPHKEQPKMTQIEKTNPISHPAPAMSERSPDSSGMHIGKKQTQFPPQTVIARSKPTKQSQPQRHQTRSNPKKQTQS